MKRFLFFAFLVCGLMTSFEGADAQFSPGARSVGMGGAGLVFADGADAVDWNPANLTLSDGWSSTFLDVGGAGLVFGTTLGDLQEIASAGGGGDGGVVSRLPDTGLSISTVIEGFALDQLTSAADLPETGSALPTVGISFGQYGLKVRSRVFIDASMSRELVDLTVNGYDETKIQEYRVGDTELGVTSVSEVTASYGQTFRSRLSWGVGIRYVRGNLLSRGRLFEPEIDLGAETLLIRSAEVQSQGGSGYGMDLGLGVELPFGLRVSLSGRNVMQNMEWDEALVSHEAVLTGTDFDNNDFEELIDLFVEQSVDPTSVSLPVYEASRDLFHESYFPTVITVGVGWRSGSTTLELVGSRASPNGRFRSVWDDRVSLGAEQRLGFLALRAGFAKASDGVQAASGGIGLNLGPVGLDISGGILSGSMDGIDYTGTQATVGLSIRGEGR